MSPTGSMPPRGRSTCANSNSIERMVMQWSDVTATPNQKRLRQFAVLCLVIFVGLAAWRAAPGEVNWGTWLLATAGVTIGGPGIWRPTTIRYVYSGWMIAAFPIGWTVSRLMIAAMFFIVFTPVALLFRVLKRDALHLRGAPAQSYWTPKSRGGAVSEYLRQS